ncbi:alpha/beta fold hydrolase [Pontibacter akesuensis]|uniref:Haloalkane dehalogenase n=1 Tax=Pontibacter akesuensis TaxID=388950 RepID=A0A1I7K2F6_9BACT|nr:alpha/beta fold hydrolase [Pontibacter akesuensis]GHA75593.1 haloalkane dehalogenase [Pontibacter akesuensis]SFU91607.1 haloalkane dehalogenase [Pontibacter akesuensis]
MKPNWLDKKEYPFKSHYITLEAGRMHYIDEGEGTPIVMIHGTPAWSFLYRNLIKILSKKYRCIAMDMIGFGLSDKPEDWSYKPRAHAANFEKLMEHLQLQDITLLVHDFGTPIGMAYAINHPDNVRNIVMLNSWTWSLSRHETFPKSSKLLVGPLGQFLHSKLNVSAATLIHDLFEEEENMPEPIKQHYIKALGSPEDHVRNLACARELVGATKWYDELWQERKKIQQIPTLILWGERDKLIHIEALQRWKKFFHECYVIPFEEGGHFLQEDSADEISNYVSNFVQEEKKKHEPVHP